MNLLQKNVAAAGLLAGAAILSGSPAMAQSSDISSIAETLGLPVGTQKAHFNKATQTAILEECELVSSSHIQCSLDVFGNEALLEYSQVVDYKLLPSSSLSVETSIYHVAGAWTPNTFDSGYAPVRDNAQIVEWSAQSPLAMIAQDGSGRVVQNDSKGIQLADSTLVEISSSIPVNDLRGFDVHTIFNDTNHTVQSYIVPRIAYASTVLSAQPETKARRDLDYASEDVKIMDRYIKRAQDAGGMAYRFPE